ncbi:uncharacterized protein LOC131245153 [Magnolia sinica]|uniref:uncharacterized protein LOC131245153 n=1 Tax=Magnolia sinica TaxID=86752 RepID=UPI002658771E|nr:uncharacterized protein LOC131245153 [Magnolia sinica]
MSVLGFSLKKIKKMKRNVAAEVVSVLLLFFLASLAKVEIYSYPSRCGDGDVITIKYPFRFKDDPQGQGNPRYELGCEANRTILLLDSKVFYVKAISYENKTIRIVEPGLSDNNCSSLPRNPFLDPDKLVKYPYYWSRKRLLVFLKCQNSVDDSWYIDASPCTNGSDFSSSSWQGHTYVRLQYGSSIGKLPVPCNPIAMIPTDLREDINRSIIDIHMELMMGFEIAWSKPLNCNEDPFCAETQSGKFFIFIS